MNHNFRTTKAGVTICPFFCWTSEDIERLGQSENDVNLVICQHENNEHQHEGNCQEEYCPILEQHSEKNCKSKCKTCNDTMRIKEKRIDTEGFGFYIWVFCPDC